ncbi:MAG: LysM peptidoglycan-binding domain-containing protein [Solirubrobacteraceae bacterium]
MAEPTGFKRAKLEIEGGKSLECWFNPSEYAITKSNDWTMRPIVGASLPPPQFSGGHPRELNLDLLFHADPDGDVTAATDALFGMMEVDARLSGGNRNQARPPTITFGWGTYRSFTAVCSQLSVQFTLFRPDGTPTRAQAQMSLIQVAKDPKAPNSAPAAPQNPTTRATDHLAAHVVRDGDSLASIAYEHYGDPTRWRKIAETNGIDDPLRIRRGATLSIPLAES